MNRGSRLVWLALLAACGPCRQEPVVCEGPRTLDVAPGGVTLVAGDCIDMDLRAQALGDGSLEVELIEVDGAVVPVVTAGSGGAVLEAVVLEGPVTLDGNERVRIWKQGYQSWWWSGVTELEDVEFGDDGLPVAGGDGDGMSSVDETPFTSWWLGLAGRHDGASVLLGALQVTRTKLYVAFSEDHAWAVWGGRGEAIDLAEGEQVELDPLWMDASSDPVDLHRSYAQAALDHGGLSARTDLPPTGWATWYQFYSEVTEDDVRSNLEVAADIEDEGRAAGEKNGFLHGGFGAIGQA
ncbi:MAG: hypothetical protein QGG40_02825 [Myxococcota bacterium]|nr:hypothetical protein [Myxococcota bacterium]